MLILFCILQLIGIICAMRKQRRSIARQAHALRVAYKRVDHDQRQDGRLEQRPLRATV